MANLSITFVRLLNFQTALRSYMNTTHPATPADVPEGLALGATFRHFMPAPAGLQANLWRRSEWTEYEPRALSAGDPTAAAAQPLMLDQLPEAALSELQSLDTYFLGTPRAPSPGPSGDSYFDDLAQHD